LASIYLYNEEKSIHDLTLITSFLAKENIAFGTFPLSGIAVDARKKEELTDTERQQVLDSHAQDSAAFQSLSGFRQDVVCFWPSFSHLDYVLSRFAPIHFHYENEYWYCFDGAACFTFLGNRGEKYRVTLEPGEYLRVPEGRWQWFELTESKYFKSMRFFYTSHSVPTYETPAEFLAEIVP